MSAHIKNFWKDYRNSPCQSKAPAGEYPPRLDHDHSCPWLDAWTVYLACQNLGGLEHRQIQRGWRHRTCVGGDSLGTWWSEVCGSLCESAVIEKVSTTPWNLLCCKVKSSLHNAIWKSDKLVASQILPLSFLDRTTFDISLQIINSKLHLQTLMFTTFVTFIDS